MKPAQFRYRRPTTVDEAVHALSQNGRDTEVLAGGQSLIPMMNFRRKRPKTLIDINRIEELDYVRESEGVLAIGAMVRQADLADSEEVIDSCPLVSEALSYVGHKPTRHRGTIGGNVANADPASELPAVAIAQDATFVIRSSDDEREVAAEDFFEGRMGTAIGAGELLTEIRIPTLDDGQGYAFLEQRPRDHGWAIAGVAATLSVDERTCREARLVYIGIDDRPLRVEEAEDAIAGAEVDEEAFEEAATTARENVDPPSFDEVTADDLRNNQRTGPTDRPQASMHAPPEFRRQLVETLTRRALASAAERAEGT